MTTDNSIVLTDLTKRYRGSTALALDHVSLSVAPGEVYGFLGANGAGKSTTIRTLLNFIQPTGGHARILGRDIVRDAVDIKQHVGYLAGDVAVYDKMTGREFLDYMAALQPLPNPAYKKQLVKELDAELSKPLRELSKGNRQKIGIIQALMHEPSVLILDEPTSGLDPLRQEAFFDAIRRAKQNGASVFFSSHNLAEVQRICDRVGFIREGKLVREQTMSNLAANAAHTFDITFVKKAPATELAKLTGAEIAQARDPHHVSVVVPSGALSSFFAILAKHDVQQFQQREVNLEEEFMQFYREDT